MFVLKESPTHFHWQSCPLETMHFHLEGVGERVLRKDLEEDISQMSKNLIWDWLQNAFWGDLLVILPSSGYTSRNRHAVDRMWNLTLVKTIYICIVLQPLNLQSQNVDKVMWSQCFWCHHAWPPFAHETNRKRTRKQSSKQSAERVLSTFNKTDHQPTTSQGTRVLYIWNQSETVGWGDRCGKTKHDLQRMI